MTRRKKHCISMILLTGLWLPLLFSFHEKPGSVPLITPVALDSLPPVTVPFVDSLCFITDPANVLNSFYRELDALSMRKDTTITIVHLGDSHIQAGYQTGRTMRRLQDVFGNAGRGWVAPLKLSRANEPNDYFINSVIREWQTGRCIQRNPKASVGIGGFGIRTVSPSVNFDLIIGPVNGLGYSFNQAVFYRDDKSMPMLPAGILKDSIRTSLAADNCAPGILADTFFISCLTDTLQLHSTRRKQGTDSLLPASSFTNTYYGFKLTNGSPGLLYHSIGVNGAMFIHYTDRDYLKQLSVLKPSLLIISMGTNESFGRRFNKPEFKGQVQAFIRLVKEILPGTTLMLTTPAEGYKRVTVNKKRTYIRNENIEKAADVITDVALEEGLACWDLFRITGGKNSYRRWYEKKLTGRDRIHFTKEGYQEQGELLYRALIRSYNTYIKEKEEWTDC